MLLHEVSILCDLSPFFLRLDALAFELGEIARLHGLGEVCVFFSDRTCVPQSVGSSIEMSVLPTVYTAF